MMIKNVQVKGSEWLAEESADGKKWDAISGTLCESNCICGGGQPQDFGTIIDK